jgi:hypothetical protein
VSFRTLVRLLVSAAMVLAIIQPRTANAHGRSVSYSNWSLREDGGASVRLRVSLVDLGALKQFKSDESGLPAYLRDSLTLAGPAGACAPNPGTFHNLTAKRGWMAYEWTVSCEGTPAELNSELFLAQKPMHVHFARLSSAAASSTWSVERVLNDGNRTVSVPQASPPAGSWFGSVIRYIPIGFEHILSGLDHLMFLLVLVLLGTRLRWLLGVVTGFTLGHSVTLGLATLGYATPAVTTVEALVGLSIALVAVENVWALEKEGNHRIPAGFVAALLLVAGLSMLGAVALPSVMLFGLVLFAACYFAMVQRSRHSAQRVGNLRWAVAALFGLVHGFAFAEVLHGAELPASRLVPALLGFNVGVEAGQVAVLVVAWPALVWVRRRGPEAQASVVRWGSALAVCAGVYWFVSRGF